MWGWLRAWISKIMIVMGYCPAVVADVVDGLHGADALAIVVGHVVIGVSPEWR